MRVTAASSYGVDALVHDARAATGAGEDEQLEFLDALTELSTALDRESRLSAEGRAAVRRSLVTSLATQVELRRHLAANPDVARTPITRPVFIVGLLRTGSTLVHNLLAQHPDMRCPNLWELLAPVGPRDPRRNEADARAAQAYVEDYYQHAPDLPKIHFLDARRPDECHRLLGNTFQSMVFWMRFRVPGYARWLRGRDLTAAYRYHRLLLQSILWRIPGGVPVLKCPFHIWSLKPLLAAYPDARFIHLHRSPTTTVPSTCSLSAVLQGARMERVDRAEIGRFWLAEVERGLMHFMDTGWRSLAANPVLDVRYADLTADPMAVISRICHFLDVPMTDDAARRMRRYLDENPANRHGVHRYTATEFGLSAADLDARFARYREHYDL
jgi:Sulfotransferase family